MRRRCARLNNGTKAEILNEYTGPMLVKEGQKGLMMRRREQFMISSQGYRHVMTQMSVNWRPCYGVVGITESAGIAED